ncbi:PRC-barrel domain-containing protein [Halobacillus salinarum]|uniref:PRC-barrel domain-containing protein n=1 Tax=Halobacillus salinarum TaxID=2932257 RepID=A0ABY4ENJ7_9BACI|nr:PRC-barrel domain-containing protein [Halobacillus salinarum]UOQ45560.1 PRC-barrel domain-containing protein [Halobacillus salinarum]
MFLSATGLEKLTLYAEDGEMGKVKDLYFDDHDYTVRYLTIVSKRWFPDQVIYLSPSAISRVDFDEKRIEVNHTRSELRNRAGVTKESEMSPEKEEELSAHFNWSKYWAGELLWGDYPTPDIHSNAAVQSPGITERKSQLRSINHMKGVFSHAHVVADDGDVGYIQDVFIEKETWRIRYFLTNSGKWSTHTFALVSPDWIDFADWKKDNLQVNMSLEDIERGPLYRKGETMTRDFEKKLYESYDKKPYWE